MTAAMGDSRSEGGGALPEMPRFHDGMASVGELMRAMTVPLVNGVMGAQAEEA